MEASMNDPLAPARAIKQDQIGHLSVGAIADVAVLRGEKESFGFTDSTQGP